MPAAFSRSFAERRRGSQHATLLFGPNTLLCHMGVLGCCVSAAPSTARYGARKLSVVRYGISACEPPALRCTSLASPSPGCGCMPRPQTWIVYAPTPSASMPSPSYTPCAGPSQRAARESDVRIMFTGREGSRLGKVAPAERCIEGPGVGTCANSLANASPRGMQLVRMLPLPLWTPLDQRRPLCQSLTQPSGVVRPEGRSCRIVACTPEARRW